MSTQLVRVLCALSMLLFVSGVQAATVSVTLTDVVSSDGTFATTADSITGTITGSYDTISGMVTMDAGTTSVRIELNVGSPTHAWTGLHTNWTTGGGGYSATSFSCTEGTLGAILGASFCGAYNFGGNGFNESFLNYSTIPGTRTLGGDDFVTAGAGAQQQGLDFATSTVSFGGGTLFMETAGFNTVPGLTGAQLTFSVAPVPVPAAAWLFGSALGLLGWMRRKIA